MHIYRHWVSLVGLVVLFTPEASGTLIAAAPRRFPASACEQVGTAGHLVITGNDGAIYNSDSTSTLTVDCPVLSNGLNNNYWAPNTALTVWYLDHSTSAIVCVYKAEDQLSTSVSQKTLQSTGDDYANYRYLAFSQADIAHFNHNHVHIRCNIPPRDATGNASYLVGFEGF